MLRGIKPELGRERACRREALRTIAVSIRCSDRVAARGRREAMRTGWIALLDLTLGEAVIAEEYEVRPKVGEDRLCDRGERSDEAGIVEEFASDQQTRYVLARPYDLEYLLDRRAGARRRILRKQR